MKKARQFFDTFKINHRSPVLKGVHVRRALELLALADYDDLHSTDSFDRALITMMKEFIFYPIWSANTGVPHYHTTVV